MTDSKISIIVPVYRAEDVIGRCIESILAQSYPHFELILVNDGSDDNSLPLCQRYAEKDGRIRILSQENSGVSAARNKGLAAAEGEYVSFVDADDALKPDYLEHLIKKAEEQNADLVCCDFEQIALRANAVFYEPRVLRERKVEDRHSLFADAAAAKEGYFACVWAKLFKTELAQKVSFRPFRFGEDHLFMYEIFLLSPTVYLDPYQGYRYYLNESSVTGRIGFENFDRCKDEMKMKKFKAEHLPDSCLDLLPVFYEQYCLSVLTMVHAMLGGGQKKEEKEEALKEAKSALKKRRLISPHTKGKLLLFTTFPHVYGMLLSLKKRIR